MTEFKISNIKQLKSKLSNLDLIRHELKCRVHGIDAGYDINGVQIFEPFEPTKFIYTFFLFNAIYEIDWDESMKQGEIINSNLKKEDKKISAFIKALCSMDMEFVKTHMRNFSDFLNSKYTDIESYKNVINKIIIDSEFLKSKYVKGNNLNEDAMIDSFKYMHEGKITQKRISDIAFFIYKTRCNIFHGSKDMHQMNTPDQKERLEIYTEFLICLIDMPFYYLEHKLAELRQREVEYYE